MTSLMERVAFYLFVGAIASLMVMATLPAPKKPEADLRSNTFTFSEGSKQKKILVSKEIVSSKTSPEENWIPLFRQYLWQLVYSNEKQTLFRAKQFFQQIPRDIANPYVETLLHSPLSSEINMGAVGVRYLKLNSLIPSILLALPSVGEDENDARVPFYLKALEIGDKNCVSHLFAYLDSKVIHHRLIALESLSSLHCPEIVPLLLPRFLDQKNNAEFHALQRTIIQLMSPPYYSELQKFFASSRPELRRNALQMMVAVNSSYFLDSFKEALSDEDWSVRRQAYFLFLKLREKSVAPLFLKVAQDPKYSREEQILAFQVASCCGKELSPSQISSFLTHKDPLFRFLGYALLAHLRKVEAIPALIELLEIPEEQLIVEQGSDLEEEHTWLKAQIGAVLSFVTQKEVSPDFSWKQWWKSQKHFKFPAFEYMEITPRLYENR